MLLFLQVLILSLQRYCEIQAKALSYINICLKWLATESRQKNSFFIYTDSVGGRGLAGLILRRGLKPQLIKNGEMPVLLLTQLFIVNLVSSRQLIQSSYIKLIKVQRYLFMAVLTISVQLFIFRYQAEFNYKVVLKRLFSYY